MAPMIFFLRRSDFSMKYARRAKIVSSTSPASPALIVLTSFLTWLPFESAASNVSVAIRRSPPGAGRRILAPSRVAGQGASARRDGVSRNEIRRCREPGSPVQAAQPILHDPSIGVLRRGELEEP